MIRRATFDDIPAMLELGRRAHAASRYAEIPIDEMQARLNAASMLTNKSQCIFVAEVDGKLVGMLMGVSVPWFFATKPYATDLLTYAEKPGVGLQLVRRFVKWAFQERRVSSIETSISFGAGDIARTERLYERMGFARVGANFVLKRAEPAALAQAA